MSAVKNSYMEMQGVIFHEFASNISSRIRVNLNALLDSLPSNDTLSDLKDTLTRYLEFLEKTLTLKDISVTRYLSAKHGTAVEIDIEQMFQELQSYRYAIREIYQHTDDLLKVLNNYASDENYLQDKQELQRIVTIIQKALNGETIYTIQKVLNKLDKIEKEVGKLQ